MTSILCAKCGIAWPEHNTVCGTIVKQVDMPLVCRREGQQLVIRVGIDTLAFATEHCEKFYVEEKHASGPPYVKVVDKDALVGDTIHALLREREDGATPLHFLFDDAAEFAMDDGSLAFDDDSD